LAVDTPRCTPSAQSQHELVECSQRICFPTHASLNASAQVRTLVRMDVRWALHSLTHSRLRLFRRARLLLLVGINQTSHASSSSACFAGSRGLCGRRAAEHTAAPRACPPWSHPDRWIEPVFVSDGTLRTRRWGSSAISPRGDTTGPQHTPGSRATGNLSSRRPC
jgi:hypothetical protein